MKNVKKGIFIFLMAIVTALLCNILAFLIPHSAVHQNIKESLPVLQQEGPLFPIIGEKYRNSIADNNTDALMLLMADYDGQQHSVLEKSVGGFYTTSQNTSNTGLYFFDMFISSMQEDNIETGVNSYSRYWHGWMLPLRLLLLFCSYEDIRYISMVFIIALLVYYIYLLNQKGLKMYAASYLAASLFILPITASVSFEYSFVYYVILIQNILMIKYFGFIKEKIGFGNYFLVTGCIISYFDFLTYPIATLGFCMASYLILTMYGTLGSVYRSIKDVILYSITWAVGYFGMWIAKWLIGTLILGSHVFTEALGQLTLRTSSTAGLGELDPEHVITFHETLGLNLGVFKTRGFLAVGLCLLCYLLFNIIKTKKYNYLKQYPLSSIPFILVFLMPFAWAFVFKNHLYLHYNFTSNIFVVSFLAAFSYLSLLLCAPSISSTKQTFKKSKGVV